MLIFMSDKQECQFTFKIISWHVHFHTLTTGICTMFLRLSIPLCHFLPPSRTKLRQTDKTILIYSKVHTTKKDNSGRVLASSLGLLSLLRTVPMLSISVSLKVKGIKCNRHLQHFKLKVVHL